MSRKECAIVFLSGNCPPNLETHQGSVHYFEGFSPFSLVALSKLRLLIRQQRPKVVVFSLWKSILAFLYVKIFTKNVRVVLFLHSSHTFHIADRVCTHLMLRLADVIFADSVASTVRVPLHRRAKARVVSFIRFRAEPMNVRVPSPNVIFWGRFQKIKNLPLAIELFSEFKKCIPTATFTLIGPDVDSRLEVEAKVAERGLSAAVKILGPMNWDGIRTAAANAAFFVQLSRQEGMGMSVVEAMQLGLVVVTTPVGEIKSYCRNNFNSLIFSNLEDCAARMAHLASDPEAYRRVSAAAVSTWVDKPIYEDDFVAASFEASDCSPKQSIL